IDPFRKRCLLEGLDAIALTLQYEADITSYENRRKQEAPWLFQDLVNP
ncbi:MAG: 3-isopropylmalate dehydratase small subunit, partial [Nitrospirae bacterium]|nr:3-isopropylmalate dehydratase small subunit [Nitrospirota bacterium]